VLVEEAIARKAVRVSRKGRRGEERRRHLLESETVTEKA